MIVGRAWTYAACVAALGAALSLAAAAQQPASQTPTFRSRVMVVPVDVRVVDRAGKPVTDLTAADFSITEDGVPQRIVHFSFQTLVPQAEPARADRAAPDFRKPLGETLAPPTRRVFLLVLGRGHQTRPIAAVEAAVKFIKERLLPQDQVAVQAYNRSTDFTTDHAKIIDTLERYHQRHASIEARLKHYFSGLAMQYGFLRTDVIPPFIQKDIDGIFRVPGAIASRSTSATEVTDGARIAADTRANADKLQRAADAADRIASGTQRPFDETLVNEAGLLDMPFDEFVEKSAETSQDLGNLYAGIRYLKYLDGEKHLVFMTRNGLFLPRLENSNSIAALANDARVTLDIVHTGGVAGGLPPQPLPPGISAVNAAALTMRSATPPTSVVFNQNFSIGSSRQAAGLTGGQMSATSTGDKFFKQLDETTRSQYLIGYSPVNGNWDGAYRSIRVTVNRPGLTVLYRHGYAAHLDVKPLNRRAYLTYSRITSAINRGEPIDDLGVTLCEPSVPQPGTMHLVVRVAPAGIQFTQDGEFYVSQLDAVYFVGDRRQGIAGEVWRTLDFKLSAANHEKFLKEGVQYTQAVPFTGEARHVKVVLYHYAADLVGSATRTLKK